MYVMTEMKQIVMMSAIAALFFVVATTGNHAKADQCWKRGDNVNDQPGWNPCSYTQGQHIQQVSEGWYPCHWRGDGFACLNNGFEQHMQIPKTQDKQILLNSY